MMIQYKDHQVCVFESALFQTTTTVIHGPGCLLVVDPNWLPGEVAAIRNFVENSRNGRPVYLLFTHSDYDHIIGYKAFPGAKVIASCAFSGQRDKENILEQIRQFDEEYYLIRDYPIEFPEVSFPVEQDGQQLHIGGLTLTFYLAPGHNEDGIFTFVEPAGIFISGDYLCDVEFPYIYFSSTEYEKTLGKAGTLIQNKKPSLLIPGHGTVATSCQDMLERIAEAQGYIDRLKHCIREAIDFPVDELWERYRFPRIMRRFHDANAALIRKEFGLDIAMA